MFRSNKAMYSPGTVLMAVITLLVVTGSIAEADFSSRRQTSASASR
jgi:hypothetical protein